jgi:hypothetical protein
LDVSRQLFDYAEAGPQRFEQRPTANGDAGDVLENLELENGATTTGSSKAGFDLASPFSWLAWVDPASSSLLLSADSGRTNWTILNSALVNTIRISPKRNYIVILSDSPAASGNANSSGPVCQNVAVYGFLPTSVLKGPSGSDAIPSYNFLGLAGQKTQQFSYSAIPLAFAESSNTTRCNTAHNRIGFLSSGLGFFTYAGSAQQRSQQPSVPSTPSFYILDSPTGQQANPMTIASAPRFRAIAQNLTASVGSAEIRTQYPQLACSSSCATVYNTIPAGYEASPVMLSVCSNSSVEGALEMWLYTLPSNATLTESGGLDARCFFVQLYNDAGDVVSADAKLRPTMLDETPFQVERASAG